MRIRNSWKTHFLGGIVFTSRNSNGENPREIPLLLGQGERKSNHCEIDPETSSPGEKTFPEPYPSLGECIPLFLSHIIGRTVQSTEVKVLRKQIGNTAARERVTGCKKSCTNGEIFLKVKDARHRLTNGLRFNCKIIHRMLSLPDTLAPHHGAPV